MSRSLKKGPFVDYKLARKVAALSAEDRTVIKTWARQSTISPEWLDAQSPSTTVKFMFQFSFQKTWSVTSSANLHQLANLNATAVKKLLKLQLRKERRASVHEGLHGRDEWSGCEA